MSSGYMQPRGVSKGRIVIYRAPTPGFSGVACERPAIILRVWSEDMVQLAVFRDGTNDFGDGAVVGWATSVHHSTDPAPHTWCWIDEMDMAAQDK